MKVTIDTSLKTLKVEQKFKLKELQQFMDDHNLDADEYVIDAEPTNYWYSYTPSSYTFQSAPLT